MHKAPNLFDLSRWTKACAVAASLAMMLTANIGRSTVYYWDPEASATPTAANLSTTWVTTAAQWSTTSALTASPVTLPANIAVCFCAGPTTMTNPVTVTLTNAVTVPGVFNGLGALPGYFVTITGAGGSINIPAGAQGFYNDGSDGGSMTFEVPITGPGEVSFEGIAPTYFHATNTYTGGTLLGYYTVPFTSIIYFNNARAFGTGPIYGVSTAPALVVESNITMNITNAFVLTNGNINIAGSSGGLTLSGPISTPSLGGTSGIGTGSPTTNLLIISGTISGAATLLKYNGSPMVLTASNTYSGGTLISNAGPLVITNDFNLGPGAIGMYAGTTLTASNSFQLSSTRSINFLGNATINVAASKTLTNSAVIGGSGFSLTKSGTGTMILDAQETYTGNTSVTAGTLALSVNGTIGSPTNLVSAGATLDISALGGYDFDSPPSASGPVTLSVTGTTSTATLKVSTFGGAIIGASSPLLISYKSSSPRGDTTHAALTVTGGPLTLDGCNITIANTLGTNFGPGTYTIIKSGTGGSLITNAPPIITFTGPGPATNCTAVVQFVTNSLQLVVTIPPSTITSYAQTSNSFTITGSGLAGSPYRLAYATNLTPPVTWSILTTNIANSNGVITLTDTNATTAPARFYRIDY